MGYGNRIRAKYTAKWGAQIAGMIFQTRSNGVRLTLFINQYFREYQNYNFYTAFTLLIQRLLPLSLPVLLLFPHL